MPVALHDSCVYTIATPAHMLNEQLYEGKRWVTARTLLGEARRRSVALPILFADARKTSKLIAWSVLQSITVDPKGTRYRIGPLWRVPGHRRPQDLQLRGERRFIAEGHIKPYVLCQTPEFLRQAARAPQPWEASSVRMQVREGRRRLAAHRRLERNASLVRALKQKRRDEHAGHLPCEVCGFDFLTTYGPEGADVAEAHHKRPLKLAPKRGQVTRLDDLAIVCANCHVMLHHGPEFPDMAALRKKLRRTRRSKKE